MDVRCNRCGTEYEFDDALISERGTTVKCTNCGLQFKIFPLASGGGPERWVVRTAAGRELVFTSLRELQRGIAERRVGPNDQLSRGTKPARPLSSIAELEPFFQSSFGDDRNARTLHGVAPPANARSSEFAPPFRGPLAGSAGSEPPDSPPLTAEAPPMDRARVATAPGLSAALPGGPGFSATLAGVQGATPGMPLVRTSTLPGVQGATSAMPLVQTPPLPDLQAAAPVAQTPPLPGVQSSTLPGVQAPLPGAEGTTLPGVDMGNHDAAAAGRARPLRITEDTLPAEQWRLEPEPRPAMSVVTTQPVPLAPAGDPPSLSAGHLTPLSSTLALEDYDRQQAERLARNVVLERVPNSSPVSSRVPLETSPRSSPNSSRLGMDLSPRPPTSTRRASFHSYDELSPAAESREHGARRARSRWIVGVVLLSMVGLVAATAGRRYLATGAIPSATPALASDARVKQFLSRGSQLVDEGDYEGAQEELVKASGLSEKDPAVLAALAKLETLRADVYWLRLRLLDPASTDLVSSARRELGQRVGRARIAVDRAFAVAPEDATVIRARIDAMRLSGESDKAREWIAPVSSNASQPENAYVLAALDLSDAAPAWTPVVERLRTAAAAERGPGRARVALVYALARAGRVAEARVEFGKLEVQPRQHVLLEELRAFLNRVEPLGGAVPDAKADPAATPLASAAAPAANGAAGVGGAIGGIPLDFRAALSQAAVALRSSDLARAERLYQSALTSQPGNVEALAGLGDVARARGDTAGAARIYDRVLQQNPSYLPALMGSADYKWAAGERAGALVLYKRVADQVGPGSEYGARARSRLTEAPAARAPSAAPASSAPSPPANAPDIDTTDLPEAP